MIGRSHTPVVWSPRIALGGALFLHVALALAAWSIGPGMNSDSATGFLLWDNWRAGTPWNHQTAPDPADITRDISFFQAWWSPGQYLAVAPLQLFSLSLGAAIALGSLAWTLVGLVGWWRLFQRFGFAAPVNALAVALLACNWTLIRNYGDYMGGELALLALAPWLILGLWRTADSPTAVRMSLAPLLVWVGAIAKNTFLPVAASVLLARRWDTLQRAKWSRRTLELGAIGAAVALGHALYWFTFLRHGWNPGSGGFTGVSTEAVLNLVRLVSFPVGGLVAFQNLAGRVFFHPAAPLAHSWNDLWLLHLGAGLLFGALAVWLVRRELRLRPLYGRLLLGATLCSIGFFALIAVTRESNGLEERFLRPCSFLFAPAAVAAAVDHIRRAGGIALIVLLGVGAAYGATSGVIRARHLAQLDQRSPRGISTALSAPALVELRRLDTALPAGSLLVVSSPDMALEIRRTRHWATHLDMQTLESVAPSTLRGRVPALVVVAGPQAAHDGRAAGLLARFVDYAPSDWTRYPIGNAVFFRAGRSD